MNETFTYNSNMHFEHKQWKGELTIWNEELVFFNNRINELVKRGANKNVLVKLEHYQNAFILHLTIMGIMHEDIDGHELQIATQNKENINALDCHMMKKHGDFRHKFEKQRQVYSNLKKSFFRFIERYM